MTSEAVKYGTFDRDTLPQNTLLLMCDMQEKFRKAVSHFDQIAEKCNRLTTASKILGIPLIVTEQYPQGLGNTVQEIDIGHAKGVFPKTRFTMFIPEVEQFIKDPNVMHVILCGVETHVCIQQTVTDLLKANVCVHVVADAVSSRASSDRHIALERFRQLGAFVTTSEAILLDLVGDKDHPNFKQIQKLIMPLVNTGLYELDK